jgi:hypothetical protein
MLSPVCCVQGHSWCKSCVSEWLDKNQTCPVDRDVLTSATLTRNRPVENVTSFLDCFYLEPCLNISTTVLHPHTYIFVNLQMISKLDITCNWKNQDCPWSGHRRLFIEHSSDCHYRLITCEYCAVNIQKRKVDDHEKSCVEYPMKCHNVGCNWTGVRREFDEHVSNCVHRMINCDDCEETMKFITMQEHCTSFCQYRFIPCEYCGVQVQVRSKCEHENICDEFPVPCPFMLPFDVMLKHVVANLVSSCG